MIYKSKFKSRSQVAARYQSSKVSVYLLSSQTKGALLGTGWYVTSFPFPIFDPPGFDFPFNALCM